MGIKIIRIAVVAGVLAVCYLLLVKIPDAVAALSAAILSHSKNQLPAWGTIFLSILFGYYLLTVIFPFLLTIGWVLFTPRKRQAGSTDPFISIIIPASNEEKSILRSLQALSKIVTSMYPFGKLPPADSFSIRLLKKCLWVVLRRKTVGTWNHA